MRSVLAGAELKRRYSAFKGNVSDRTEDDCAFELGTGVLRSVNALKTINSLLIPRGGDGFSADEVFAAIRHQMLLREHTADAHPDPTCADVAAAATGKSLSEIHITQYSQTIMATRYPTYTRYPHHNILIPLSCIQHEFFLLSTITTNNNEPHLDLGRVSETRFTFRLTTLLQPSAPPEPSPSPPTALRALRDKLRLRPLQSSPGPPRKSPHRLSLALDGLARPSEAFPLAVAVFSLMTSTTMTQSRFSTPRRSHRCTLAQSASPNTSPSSSPSNKLSRRLRPRWQTR